MAATYMAPDTQGVVFALITAFCWTISSLAFTSASTRVGSLVVNLIRLLIAFAFMCLWGWFRRGLPLPTDASRDAWLWLSLSGFVGFFIGDLTLFRAFVLIGARVSTLLMSLAPPMTALIGYFVLGERLNLLSWLGMTVTLCGILWVVSERLTAEDSAKLRAIPKWGLFLGIIGALGQAVGIVLTKKGTGAGAGAYDAVAATQIRCITGIVTFALLVIAVGFAPKLIAAVKRPDAMGLMTIGALAGPFIGVSLLNYAIQMIPTGVAQTITATVPVMIIPFVVVLHRERVSYRAVIGAIVTVAGVAMLLLA
jgi:drug/metabolite transporter (DMT)-like permease